MYDNLFVLTGKHVNELLENGWTISSDRQLLPDNVIEQGQEGNEADIVDLIQAWQEENNETTL